MFLNWWTGSWYFDGVEEGRADWIWCVYWSKLDRLWRHCVRCYGGECMLRFTRSGGRREVVDDDDDPRFLGILGG